MSQENRNIGVGEVETVIKAAATTRRKQRKYTFTDLVGIMRQLRAPDGCPWDRKQTHNSLLPYLLEESYEVIDSVHRRNMNDLRGELGDLLLQVVFHAQLADERERFSIDDVVDQICRKLIGRHPHVFERRKRLTARQVLDNWEKIKIRERKSERSSGKRKGVLDGLPQALPALLRAYRIQEKTAQFGFDWDNPLQVLDKVEEESGELRRALRRRRRTEAEHELGDLFFALVNLARHLKIDPESALAKTNRRFVRRFQYIERELPRSGRALGEASLEELDKLWERAKRVVG